MTVIAELNCSSDDEKIKIMKSTNFDCVYISATDRANGVEILAGTSIDELEKIINLLKQVHD